MTITKIIGEDGVRQDLCSGGNCPTLILNDADEVFVQGARLSAAEASQLTAPAHETYVKMPVAVLRQLAEKL